MIKAGDKKHIYATCSQCPLLSAVASFNYYDILETVGHCKSKLKDPLETKLVMCSQVFNTQRPTFATVVA